MISVEATARFRGAIVGRAAEREAVFTAMMAAAEAWGQPHRHSGVGIRRLRRGVFECRCGRDLRLIFLPAPQALVFDFAGNHDEVRAYLKNRG